MQYNRELAKRFISDYRLPIPLINEEYFFYHLNLYEEDYGSLSKYKALLNIIESQFENDCNKFLKHYYDVRENIIQTITKSKAFQIFNEMNLDVYSIKNKENISSNNIYNQSNIGKFFVSVDLKKANFQILKKIDKDIVLGAETYEELIEKFSKLDYIKDSKYTREVVFGKMNPKRHITIEKYFIIQLYKRLVDDLHLFCKNCVSMSNDELVFNVDLLYLNDKLTCYNLRRNIEKIANELELDVRVEFFHLRGYNLLFKESRSIRKTFFVKDYFCTDGKFKLISTPLPYHSICYKLYKGKEMEEIDYHFDYEGMDARFCEEFDIEEIK